MTPSWIYVLHFNDPLHHAAHYVGCTSNLPQRLHAHAMGAGSRLTRVLLERGITWQLGGIFMCNRTQMRRIERDTKNQHNAHRFCELCSDSRCIIPKGCTIFDRQLIPWRTQADAAAWSRANFSMSHVLRFASTEDAADTAIMASFRELMRYNGDEIGFIPVGGDAGLTRLFNCGKVIMLMINNRVEGYIAYSNTPDLRRIRIHQVVVSEQYRLFGYGSKLVENVQAQLPNAMLSCNVKASLTANTFWKNIGFELIHARPHKSSGNIINYYLRHPRDCVLALTLDDISDLTSEDNSDAIVS